MKRIFLFSTSLMILFISPLAWGGPFRSPYICVPKIMPASSHLEFIAREGAVCGKEEYYMKVVENGDGVTLLLPSDAPLSNDTQKDLEAYKKYYGLDP